MATEQMQPPAADALPPQMDALTFQGKQQIAFQRVPTPRLDGPADAGAAIVRIDLCGLCGSDL